MRSENQARAKMQALADRIQELRRKRKELVESGEFTDIVDAQTLDSRIGEAEEKLAEMEREHPTIAQNLTNDN